MASFVLVIEGLTGGGAERQMSQLANHLCERGHRVRLVSWTSPEVRDVYPLLPQVNRLYLRQTECVGSRLLRASSRIKAWFRLVALLKKEAPDVILSFSEASNVLSFFAARMAKRPIVVAMRTNPVAILDINPHWRKIATMIYRLADAVVVQTDAVALWCRQNCGRDAVIIPNMLRTLPDPPSQATRDALIVSVGSLVTYKDHATLLRAFAKIQAKHPHWRLLIMGNGPERSNLELLAETLGIRSRVELSGFVADVEKRMGEGSIFVLTSRFEGFPNALIEAMAMGLAPVSTDCDHGPRDIIRHGRNGLLVPVGDADALAAAVERLITDDQLRHAVAAEALNVRSRLSCQEIGYMWECALTSAMRASRRCE